MSKFIKHPNGRNYILEGNPKEKFFISYNPNPGEGIPFIASDGGSAETAIVYDGAYYILNGDFRSQYEEIAHKGIQACLDFYYANQDHRSSWSTDGMTETSLEA